MLRICGANIGFFSHYAMMNCQNAKIYSVEPDPRNYKVNFDKIKKIIKFQPIYSVDYGIKETVEYLNKYFIKRKNYTKKMGNYLIK